MVQNYPIRSEREQPIEDRDLETLNRIIDGSENLEEIEKAYKLIEKHNDNELHGIRKTHLQRLFYLTCVWSGLGRLLWFSNTPDTFTPIQPFHLEESVIIAFITSTTATIIGLYTIAAYWLFKRKD